MVNERVVSAALEGRKTNARQREAARGANRSVGFIMRPRIVMNIQPCCESLAVGHASKRDPAKQKPEEMTRRLVLQSLWKCGEWYYY